MKMDKITRARKIFDDYHGSYFHMAREGVLDEYKSYKIPRKMEILWLTEQKNMHKQQLLECENNKMIAEQFSLLGEYVAELHDKKTLNFMVEYVTCHSANWDSNTTLRNINVIFSTYGFIISDRQKDIIRKKCVEILKESISAGIWISDDYKENGLLPDYLFEEELQDKIQRAIQYWSNNRR